jgi:dTDP-4-amino-4,6-dideoxygalactose transaminase
MLHLCRGDLWDGNDVARFERAFAAFIGVADAVAVPSGRAGLRFTFDAMGLEPGAEVICSAFGYPIVPFLAKTLGYDLRFVDCEMQTLGMDPEALAAAISDKTRVVIATHLYGVPCQIDRIAEIVADRPAALVEDCAHCYGAAVGGRMAGSFGRAGYFSFETSKPINTMGGGMITTADAELAAQMRAVREAESPKNTKWLVKRLGKTSFEAMVTHPLLFNLGVYPALRFAPRRQGAEDRFASGYDGDAISMSGKMGRFTNYQARLGLSQMQRIGPSMERRIRNAERLIDGIRDCVKCQEPAGHDVRSNYMLVTALFPRMQQMCDRLLSMGVDTKHHYMRDCSGLFETGEAFPNAARAEREVLHLPAYPQLNDRHIDRIISKVRQAVQEVQQA